MEDYQKRMIDEFNELAVKIKKLSDKLQDPDFIKKIGEDKKTLLFAQLGAMDSYYNILLERIRLEDIKTEKILFG